MSQTGGRAIKRDFKGILKFKDGTEKIIPIPGEEKEKGAIFIPETITFEGLLFNLDKAQQSDQWFEYTESNSRSIYRMDLH